MRFRIGGLIIYLCLASSLYAQKGVEIGGWIGASHYFGDLNNLYRLNEPGLAGGLIGRYNIDTRLSTQLLFNYARLRGDDSKSNNLFDRRRNLSFFSDVIEICPSISLNFFPIIHGRPENGISPHITTGLSLFYHEPKANYQGQTYRLRSLGTEGQPTNQEYNSIAAAWFIGTGVKLDISYRWSINIDLNVRYAFSDYLDDVSQTYPNYGTLQSERGTIAVALSDPSIPSITGEKVGRTGFQRGDSKDSDMFVTVGVGLLYFFGRLDCPSISHPE
ncbi:MAG: outer membrane beta-barrel protein [Saprospiraceae bacterium]|nr:outer membrane beta-barrel protein [Saprospiraceae bacterium]